MVDILLILFLLYAAVCAAAYAYQGRMLFPAPPARDERSLPAGAERLALTTPDGVRLVGVRLPAPGPHAPLLLAFGGNGWNADAAAEYLRQVYPEAEIVAFHFRGYPPSGGTPTSRALEADSLLVHDSVARRFPGRPIVAVGFSIGSGVAAYLAGHRPLGGLILVTPFDSLTEVAVAQMPWLPVRLLFSNAMEPAAALRGSRVPTAIFAAGRDELVAAARTAGLRRAVPNLVYDRTIPGVGHNGIYQVPAFQAGMREALKKIREH
ncbi:MAG TPA: hypothetical protein VGC56_18585 [Allosphingosinicella sp.]